MNEVLEEREATGGEEPVRLWRLVASRIVEELFAGTSPEQWDLLLDLREALLGEASLERMLDLFLLCRESMEADHYLPFYRLRQLLSESLELQAATDGSATRRQGLRELLSKKHRSFAHLKRTVRRELFEHASDERGLPVRLRLIERDRESVSVGIEGRVGLAG